MKNELVVIWTTGEKEVHKYENKSKAREAENGYKMAFGNQVWTCVR